jgi:tetratricopeptide (TPR) repeat protein
MKEKYEPLNNIPIPHSSFLIPHFPHSLFLCYLLIVICYLFFSCSSRPKITGDIYDMRKDAEVQLEQGNREAEGGDFPTAQGFVEQANRFAVLTDNSSLLIRSGISLGNVLFAQGNEDEAFESWNKALEEANRAGNKELAAVCRIHIARGKLFSPEGKNAAQSLRDEVNREMASIKSDELYIAFAWTVIGLAEKELGRYAPAEDAVKRALAIHEKNLNLKLAAYDWFIIASFRSLSGNSDGALKALGSAIEYDRRTENSWGLANDWQAVGDVQKKAGNPDAARAAYLRAAAIFRAMGNNEAADNALTREK